MRKVIHIIFIAAAMLTGACSESSFQGGTPSLNDGSTLNSSNIGAVGDPGFNNGTIAQVGSRVTQRFPLTRSSNQKVDIVWAIDNSGSMREEAANVRNNFNSFISSLGSSTNLKLALISIASGIYGTTIPVVGPNFLQLPQTVQSTDALLIAAAASCRADTNNLRSGVLCGQRLGTGRAISNPTATKVSGQLGSFFREDAHRIYVVVTDDNASTVDHTNFLSLMQIASRNPPTVFAFKGSTSRAGCSVARPGVAYETLAAATGGKTFDICDTDWTPHFAALTQSVTSIANTEFVLAKSPATVESLKVGGRLVSPSQYQLFGKKLRIDANILSGVNDVLEIIYLEKQ